MFPLKELWLTFFWVCDWHFLVIQGCEFKISNFVIEVASLPNICCRNWHGQLEAWRKEFCRNVASLNFWSPIKVWSCSWRLSIFKSNFVFTKKPQNTRNNCVFSSLNLTESLLQKLAMEKHENIICNYAKHMQRYFAQFGAKNHIKLISEFSEQTENLISKQFKKINMKLRFDMWIKFDI